MGKFPCILIPFMFPWKANESADFGVCFNYVLVLYCLLVIIFVKELRGAFEENKRKYFTN